MELSLLHLLSHLAIEFCIFSSVFGLRIQCGLTLHADFTFSEPVGYVFLVRLSSPSTIHVLFGVVPGLGASCQMTDKILIKLKV